MAARLASRQITRRFSSGGRVLSEEKKAAENVYIKKTEQEKLEKLACEGLKADEAVAAASGGSGGSVIEATPSSSSSSSGAPTEKVSKDKYRNYAVGAGVVTAFGALGWYLMSGEKKEQIQDYGCSGCGCWNIEVV